MTGTGCREGRELGSVTSSSWVSGHIVTCKWDTAMVFGTAPLYVVDPETWLIMQSCNKNCYMAYPAALQQFLGKGLHCNFPFLKLSAYLKKFWIL